MVIVKRGRLANGNPKCMAGLPGAKPVLGLKEYLAFQARHVVRQPSKHGPEWPHCPAGSG
jgi:hypothetical protein